MKCPMCGSDIPESMLLCPDCGYEIQMVPDYNPMDDVLAKEIEDPRGRNNAARRARAARERAEKQRRAQIQRKRREAKKRRDKQRRTLIILLLLLFALAGLTVFLIYWNSYSGLISRGKKAYAEQNYTQAHNLLERAIGSKPSSADAYKAIYPVYLAEDDAEGAEDLLLGAVDSYPEETAMYRVLFDYYIDSKQSSKIAFILDDIDASLRRKLGEYDTAAPKASLEEGEYDDVQQVSLTASGAEEIYYTIDGSEPTKDSIKYTEPIQVPEGVMLLQAIAVNKKGVESLPASFNYTVELPIADAPAVTPSTGQYSGAQKIQIAVPEGYTAYYTLDGTEPSETSEKYSEPIDMPAGNTIFSAVLVSPDGKLSDITKRNYERQ